MTRRRYEQGFLTLLSSMDAWRLSPPSFAICKVLKLRPDWSVRSPRWTKCQPKLTHLNRFSRQSVVALESQIKNVISSDRWGDVSGFDRL